MPVIKSIKDIVVGQAMRLAGSPRVSKLASDPRLMNAAMKALSLGGTLKTGMDRAGGLAAGVFGLATQQEVANLRATIQQLEDTVSTLEARAAAAKTAPSP
jgi:outer membrane murein-binding lipoprotein Lpp